MELFKLLAYVLLSYIIYITMQALKGKYLPNMWKSHDPIRRRLFASCNFLAGAGFGTFLSEEKIHLKTSWIYWMLLFIVLCILPSKKKGD